MVLKLPILWHDSFKNWTKNCLHSETRTVRIKLHPLFGVLLFWIYFFAAAMGRSQSTPGLVESRGRIPLEDMWVSPYSQHSLFSGALPVVPRPPGTAPDSPGSVSSSGRSSRSHHQPHQPPTRPGNWYSILENTLDIPHSKLFSLF